MNNRLTSAQLRDLRPGDRVFRLLLGDVQVATVERVTDHQIIVLWPNGEQARYWRENGVRTNCRGELLRQPNTDMSKTAWLEALNEHLNAEMARHETTEDEQSALADELRDFGSSAHELLQRCASAKFDPRDTATLLADLVIRRRLPLVGDAAERDPVYRAVLPDWAAEIAGA